MVEKPQLRGMSMRTWGYATGINLLISAGVAVWYKINVVDRRKAAFKEFWNTWDDDKEYAAMKAAGIFKGYVAD